MTDGARRQVRLATATFVRAGQDVLLIRRGPTSARFAGHWNGIGGHVEPGEDILEGAHRELREEAGLDVAGLRLRGVLHESRPPGLATVVFLFVGESATRVVRPAPGLEIAWHPLAELDRLPLVGDVGPLLPRLLRAREPFFATERYDDGDRCLSLRIGGEDLELGGPRAARAEGARRAKGTRGFEGNGG